MRHNFKYWTFSCLLMLNVSCDYFSFKSKEEDDNDPAVAAVGNITLRHSELASITKETDSPSDSTNLANRYVQTWIKKHLMIKEAGNKIPIDEAELNRKLLDYKYALMVYEYEKAYIEENIDLNISNEEILAYYNANQENFSLKEIIVRTNYLKMEKGISQNRQADQLLSKETQNNKTNLRELALKYANNYFLEDSTWVKFDDILSNTPLADHNNKVQLLRQNKMIKVDDNNYSYYFKILEYKLQDQVPPIEFVSDEISKIILNKRKVAIAEQLQKDIYNRALENNEFKIYE
ncbi:peptidylprolyl isomerase [Pararhodonellum marinum]|uniref:peptidylprolyl isomerase n=1 Tax=Pararhodonellum marinum TaxID=2755358 RepID=UPI001E2D3AE6|nr:peptidylprolyl isomerase [Pararhodonellum marinum]